MNEIWLSFQPRGQLSCLIVILIIYPTQQVNSVALGETVALSGPSFSSIKGGRLAGSPHHLLLLKCQHFLLP